MIADEADPFPAGDGQDDPWEARRARARPMTPERVAYRERLDRATARARVALKPGDRVSRKLCGGGRGTFTFTGWQGDWLCGRSVDDCHASSVVKVNGAPTSFDDPEPATAWHVLIEAMNAADRASRIEASQPMVGASEGSL